MSFREVLLESISIGELETFTRSGACWHCGVSKSPYAIGVIEQLVEEGFLRKEVGSVGNRPAWVYTPSEDFLYQQRLTEADE